MRGASATIIAVLADFRGNQDILGLSMHENKPDSQVPGGGESHRPPPRATRSSPAVFLLRGLGALKLAVALIAVYAAVLVWATAVEKVHGTEAAHSIVYGAGWFVGLNALLAINILAAVAIRFPWRRRQAGFVVAHLGVVVLLIGCLFSWLWGVQAQLSVVEGRSAHLALVDTAGEPAPLELGFQVYLRKFRRKLDPGSATASHYSSLVDFLDRNEPPKVLEKNVLITLNAPVDFTDPQSGRTYRLFQSSFAGPWRPGQKTFERLIGGRRDRDHVYRSVLSVNYDPGRWWKYIGSLLIVVGIVLVYYGRPFFARRASLAAAGTAACGETGPTCRRPLNFFHLGPTCRRPLNGLCLVVLVLFSAGARAGETEPLDWSRWRALPAFGKGRIEPLDTFARKTVEAICGRDAPTLTLEDGRRREFSAAELLFAWLAEPERWEHVAFLPAEDPRLRREVLELPLRDEGGRRLRFVSPAEVEGNPHLDRYWNKLLRRAKEQGEKFRLSETDRLVKRLDLAYARYRRLTFDAAPPKIAPRRFLRRVRLAGNAWHELFTDPQCAVRIATDERVRQLVVESSEAWKDLIDRFHGEEFSRAEIEPAAAAFRRVSEKLAELIGEGADRPLAALAADLRQQTVEMHLALYDNGDPLRLVPALNPGALEENRDPDDDASPWLGFQAMIDGAEGLLRDYPRPELGRARAAHAELRTVYMDREAEDRAKRFADAMDRFARSIRALAERIEPLRRGLPLLHRDRSLLDATAYPPPGATAAEVLYNRLDPFFWSWVAGAAAAVCLLLAVGRLLVPAFWLGLAALTASLGFNLVGLGSRTYITGLVPLTGMFESVVVVGMFVCLLGPWLTLSPLFGRVFSGRRHVGPVSTPRADVPSAAKRASRIEAVLRRRLFALAGAIVGTLVMALAYYAPATVMHREIGAAMPILRDNFWLLVHVVTIMAGYASAAIALILGNAALGYYLFGRYEKGSVRHPPAACSLLAGFIYTAVKITVLLLAAGTILGALWADVSWGRFWGWDVKEVWALISLLVYLCFLHARHVGWSGNFGFCPTAVLGATVILFNWYGVNFILGSGLHAYASGAGGQLQVTAAVALQWLFLIAAAGRYLVETRVLRPHPTAVK